MELTVEEFFEKVAKPSEDYIVKIKLKYDHESNYRHFIAHFYYDLDWQRWISIDDYDEGEQEIYIVDYVIMDDIFVNKMFAQKYIRLLIDKIEHLNSHAVCHNHEDIPKEIYEFLEKEGD